MPIDDGVVIAEKVGGQRPIRALDAHVIEQIAVLAGGEGTVGKGTQASAHIVFLDMGLNAEDGGDDPGDDGQTDHAP